MRKHALVKELWYHIVKYHDRGYALWSQSGKLESLVVVANRQLSSFKQIF